jgi:hypothetical protein
LLPDWAVNAIVLGFTPMLGGGGEVTTRVTPTVWGELVASAVEMATVPV